MNDLGLGFLNDAQLRGMAFNEEMAPASESCGSAPAGPLVFARRRDQMPGGIKSG